MLREHLRLPGTGVTAVRYFRDKLIMREATARAGILVPPFIGIKNYDELRDYMDGRSRTLGAQTPHRSGVDGHHQAAEPPKKSGARSTSW